MIEQIRHHIKRIHQKNDFDLWIIGSMGKHEGSSVIFDVPGRPGYVFVTIRQANGAQTTPIARNEAGVAHSADLPVRMKEENKEYVIYGKFTRPDIATVTPPPPSGVPTHLHNLADLNDVELVAAATGDILVHDGTNWVDSTSIPIAMAATIDAATEQTAPEAANRFPLTDTGVLKWISWTNILAALSVLYEALGAVATHAALTTTHGATGAIVGTTNTQTLTNKTLTAPTIADFTNAQHDHLDADDGGLISASYTDEQAQDAVGTILVDSATIDFTYTDATPEITAIVVDNSITYAKMQDIATDSLIGRDTAATGDPETISLNTTLSMTGAGALQRAALTGDVTAAAGSNATTIANDAVTTAKILNGAVTYAKIQNVSATDKLLGRSTAGAGVVEEIALTAYARSLIDDIDAAAARTTLGLGTIATEAETAYVKVDGTRPLTGEWDIGEDMAIRLERLEARDAEGLAIQDDGGNTAIFIEDGGQIGMGGNVAPAYLVDIAATAVLDGMRITNPASGGGPVIILDATNATPGNRYTGLIYASGGVNQWSAQLRAGDGHYHFFDIVNVVTRMILTSTGLLGIGTTAPQGKAHAYDGTAAWMFRSVQGVVGSEVEIVAAGTGDVAKGFVAMVVCEGSAGTTLVPTALVGIQTPAAGSTDSTISALITFRLHSTGQLTVLRASGTETWSVAMNILWQ